MENQHEQLYIHDNQVEQYNDSISRHPPGYRFVPDDEELINDYLKKIVHHPERGRVYGIFTVNLYDSGPDELTAVHKPQCENRWYFFTQRNRKYAKGKRPDRAAGKGFWKQTDIAKPIFIGVNEQKKRSKIGKKTTLDFYSDRNVKELRSDWKMKEYRLDGNRKELDQWCLCMLYKSKSSKAKMNKKRKLDLQEEGEPSSGTQLIVAQEHNEYFAGELDANFAPQNTAAAIGNQQMIVQEQYNGPNAGGPDPNFIQQTPNLQFNNNAFGNLNNPNYMANFASGSMHRMQYTTHDPQIEYHGIYPITGSMRENAGYVQPLRSLAPGGVPTWSDSNINQSSSSIPDHAGSMRENAGYVQPLRSLAPGGVPTWSDSNINQSSSSIPDHAGSMRENAGYVQPLRSLAPGGVPTWSDPNINQSSSSIPDHAGSMRENAGYVQPLRSLAPGGVPTWSDSNINQSSSSIPDHVASEWDQFDFPSDIEFTFDDIEFGNQKD